MVLRTLTLTLEKIQGGNQEYQHLSAKISSEDNAVEKLHSFESLSYRGGFQNGLVLEQTDQKRAGPANP